MPCTSPLQGFFDGVNGAFRFSQQAQEAFRAGHPIVGSGAVPCGQCLDCRLKRKREWAIRCMHEETSWDTACFLTFTFSQKSLVKLCPLVVWEDPWNSFTPDESKKDAVRAYSIARAHMQKFNKDLRERLAPLPIRFMYCGEYGGRTQRPHYHSIVFNYDFPDKKLYRYIGTKPYYNSDLLSSLWPYGHAVISGFNFDTAAYVGGYVTEKVGGKGKEFHYKGRLPEFAGYSLKPGLGGNWFDKYWCDVYPRDECVVNLGKKTCVLRPPRYYDKLMKEKDPVLFEQVLAKRKEQMLESASDNTFERLLDKHKNTVAKFKLVTKRLETESD
ncbi:MAG: replication initiator protein [Arizlama microvirus]|nr:MAG: replication initiator protein [Arizlama microvirus]